MEAAAGADDELMEKYFEERRAFSDEDTMRGLRKGILDGTVVPVVCCSALTRVGLAKLLDNIIDLMPSPAGTEIEGVNPKTGECRRARLRRGSALLRPRLQDPGRPVRGQAVPSEGRHPACSPAARQLYNANAEKTEKPGTIYFLRGKKQNPPHKVVRGRYLRPGQAGSPSPPATPCATPTSPMKFEDLRVPGSLHLHGRLRQEGRRGRQDLLRAWPA